MWSTTVSLCLCLTVGISHEWIIDNFEYSSSAEARNIWRAVKGTPPVNVTVVEGKRVLEFQAPFASNPRLERTILDRDVTLDLSGVGSLVLEVNVNNSEVTPRLSLYFRSGGGWFAAGSLLAPLNWQTVIFRPSDFATEGNPSGWHAIDGVRISIWRPAEQDFTVRLRKLVAKWHDVALILPTPNYSVFGRVGCVSALRRWVMRWKRGKAPPSSGLGCTVVGATFRPGFRPVLASGEISQQTCRLMGLRWAEPQGWGRASVAIPPGGNRF